MGGGQRSGDSSLNVRPKPEQGPVGGVLDAPGFHPQNCPGAMECIWLSRSGRTELLWDPREPPQSSPSETPSQPGGVQVGGVDRPTISLGVHSYSVVSCPGGSICTPGRTVIPIPTV